MQTLIREQANIFNSSQECIKIQGSMDVELSSSTIKDGQKPICYLVISSLPVVTEKSFSIIFKSTVSSIILFFVK